MASRPDTPDVSEPAGSPDWRQLALVLLAVLALVVAAFAAPPLTDPPGGGSDGGAGDGRSGGGGGGSQSQNGGGSGSDGTGGAGGGGDAGTDGGAGGEGGDSGGGGGFNIGEPGNWTIRPPGEPPYDEDDLQEVLEDGCWVVAHGRPVPGQDLTVSVFWDLDPLEGSRVWFNDDPVGRTDAFGQVSGEVPYSSQFEVAAAVPDAERCRFATALPAESRRAIEPARVAASEAVTGDPAALPASGAGVALSGSASAPTSGEREVAKSRVNDESGASQVDDETPNGTASDGGETVSRTYTFEGDIVVRVRGTAYPGAEVTVTATLGGNPVEDGRVTVDGTQVGRTDESGRYRLTVPDDATGTMLVGIRRGDFAGSTRVRVHDLRLSLAPARPLPLPGQRAVARVTLAGDPVPDATVSLAGERLRRTSEHGTVGFVIPTDPRATLEATGLGQRASAPVWPLFVPTIAVSLGVLLAAAVTTRRRWHSEGAAAGKRLLVVWAGLVAILCGYIVAGGRGALVASLAVAFVLLAVLARTRGEVAVESAVTLRERLAALLRWLRRGILRVVDTLAAGVDWLRAQARDLLAWLAGQPRSVAALLRRFGAWCRALPGRVGRHVVGIIAAIRDRGFGALRDGYSHRRLTVVLLAAAVLPAAYWEWELRGALAVAIVYALALVGWLLRRGGEAREEDGAAESPASGTGPTGSQSVDDSGAVEVSLRELWRRFARGVAPTDWRTRTPVEVARIAVDRGLPAGPVERLTRAFREIEYGERTLTPEEDSAARAAYEALRDALAGDSEVDER